MGDNAITSNLQLMIYLLVLTALVLFVSACGDGCREVGWHRSFEYCGSLEVTGKHNDEGVELIPLNELKYDWWEGGDSIEGGSLTDYIHWVIMEQPGYVEQSRHVLNANLHQDGRELNWEITVEDGIDIEHAKDIVNKFVVITKRTTPDKGPTVYSRSTLLRPYEVGDGIYDYLVNIYYPDGSKFLTGYKSYDEEIIEWQP